MRFAHTFIIALSLSFAPLAAFAQDYWTGGVGKESREEAPDNMSASFEFFEAGGAYLLNLEVLISTVDTGEVYFDRTVQGPWLRINLPAGHYRIEATRPDTGEVERVRFRVEGEPLPMMGLRFNRD